MKFAIVFTSVSILLQIIACKKVKKYPHIKQGMTESNISTVIKEYASK